MHMCMCTYIYAYLHTYAHTYVRIYIHPYIAVSIQQLDGVQARAPSPPDYGPGGGGGGRTDEAMLHTCMLATHKYLSFSRAPHTCLFMYVCIYAYVYAYAYLHTCLYM